MSDAPVIRYQWADPWQHKDGTWGVALFVLLHEGDEVRSEAKACLIPDTPRAARSLKRALSYPTRSKNGK